MTLYYKEALEIILNILLEKFQQNIEQIYLLVRAIGDDTWYSILFYSPEDQNGLILNAMPIESMPENLISSIDIYAPTWIGIVFKHRCNRISQRVGKYHAYTALANEHIISIGFESMSFSNPDFDLYRSSFIEDLNAIRFIAA